MMKKGVEVLRAPLVVLVLMASFHWSALDTEKERWCIPSLLKNEPPVWREVLLFEWGAPRKKKVEINHDMFFF